MGNKSEEAPYQEWLGKADEDAISAKLLLKEEGPPSTICFLSQQAAEKALKGLLTFHKKSFPKVHDLLELESLLLKLEPGIREIHEERTLLNRYYIETRYPGDFPEFTRRESQEAYQAASTVETFVSKKVRS